MYDLYAVLVHAGSTCFSGHYYCYVKNSNGIWYCMNDSDVYQVSLQQVLKQKGAYMLFYNQRADTKSREPKVSKTRSLHRNILKTSILW